MKTEIAKLCECGCGKKTKRVKRNNNYLGIKKGDYNRFILGHNKSLLGRTWKIKDTSNMHKPIFKKGTKFSEEHKRKMRENHKGSLGKHWKLSKETIKKLSKLRKGKRTSPSTEFKKGHKHTEEVKRKMKEKRANQITPKKDTSIELKIQDFLTLLRIEFFTHKYMKIKHGYQCDILIPKQETEGVIISQKTIIECDGDYWHGNKEMFSNEKLTERIIKQRELDNKRTKELIENGFKVLRLWEHEIKVMEVNDFKDKLI